jgi:hypothetical protein
MCWNARLENHQIVAGNAHTNESCHQQTCTYLGPSPIKNYLTTTSVLSDVEMSHPFSAKGIGAINTSLIDVINWSKVRGLKKT